jgi:hypothetical protein
MKKTFTIILLLTTFFAQAQITIANGTAIGASDGADVNMQIKGNVNNGSAFDFSNTNLTLTLVANTAAQTISGNITPSLLTIQATTATTVTGNLTITDGIYFNSGIITTSGSGKILYTGESGELRGDESNSFDDSYVTGIFYVLHGGSNVFPIGASTVGYAPAIIESGNGTDEIGMEVVDGDAAFTFEGSDLQEMDHSHYWKITTNNLEGLDSKITLSKNGIPTFGTDLSEVVIQSDNVGGTAQNLLSVINENTIASRKSVTKAFIAIGASVEVDVIIHDIITPFLVDNVNDQLYIQNIDKFLVNKVTLLDRWGTPVKVWDNYGNADSPNPNTYDFSKLSPGNYICIVEYGDPDIGFKKVSQMVTVLKTK